MREIARSAGEPIWIIGSAEAALGCFTCITGEAAPDADYETDLTRGRRWCVTGTHAASVYRRPVLPGLRAIQRCSVARAGRATGARPRCRSAGCSPRAYSGRLVAAILALLWAWLGLVYHLLFFTRINALAYAFAAVSVLGALSFLWWGVFRQQLRFEPSSGWRAWAGSVLLAYALLIYPAPSWLAGHHYPASPTFGLPCPTTIFTLGVLAFLARPYPWQVFVVPVLRSVVGAQAAFVLSVPQDLGLLVAGVVGIILALRCRSGLSDARVAATGRDEAAG